MDKTDRLRDYGLAFLLYEQGLGLCGYELIRELFIFVKLILNSYLMYLKTTSMKTAWKRVALYVLRVIELIVTGAAGGAMTQM